MKKILTAMGNETLNRELMRFSKYDLNEKDLFYQEAVVDVLVEEKYDVLIISSLLQGQLEFSDFIEKIRKIDSLMRIIIICDEIDGSFKRKMSEYNIVDVFLDSNVSLKDIEDAVDREEPLKSKYITNKVTPQMKVSEISHLYEYKEKEEDKGNRIVFEEVTQKQEIIVVNGTNGAGKSTVAANFSKMLSKRTSSKILLIDFDTLNGNLDEILDIHKVPQNVEILMDNDKKCGLNYAVELISKNRFDVNVFDELVIKTGNIDVLTGNTSLYYCQNVLNENHYDTILNAAKEKYDFIIIDTSSNVFLDSTKWALQQATRVFFVTENNYISMKKAGQLMEIYTSNWKIWKNKIEIIINKVRNSGIEIEVIEKIFSDYKVIGKIKSDDENQEEPYLKVLENIRYIPKVNIINKMFKSVLFNSPNVEKEYISKIRRSKVI